MAFRSISFPNRARARTGLHWPCRRELLRPARSGYRTVPALHHSEVYVPCFDTRLLRRRGVSSSWLGAAGSTLDCCQPHVGRVGGRGLSNVSSVLSGSVGREMQRELVLHAGKHGGHRRVGPAASCHRGLLGHLLQGTWAHVSAGISAGISGLFSVTRNVVAATTSARLGRDAIARRQFCWLPTGGGDPPAGTLFMRFGSLQLTVRRIQLLDQRGHVRGSCARKICAGPHEA